MDLFQGRLKPCVRCSLEHLGRDFTSYSERRRKSTGFVDELNTHDVDTHVNVSNFHKRFPFETYRVHLQFFWQLLCSLCIHSAQTCGEADNSTSVTLAAEIQTAYQPPQKMSLKPNRLAGVNLVTHALNFVTASNLRRVDKMFFWMSDERAS